jgi:hypothetical protein
VTQSKPGPDRGYRSMIGVIRSPFPLPAPVAADDGTEGWAVVRGPARPIFTTDGDRAVVARLATHRVELGFDRLATFDIDLTTRVISVMPHPGSDDVTLASLVIDNVIPRVCADAALVLHAAATIEPDGTATVIVGPSGAGKSTMAAQACLDGSLLLSDDTVLVEGTLAWPSHVGPRMRPAALTTLGLGPDSGCSVGGASDKRRLGAADGIRLAASPAVVERIVLLTDRPPTTVRLAAMRLLSEQALNLGLFDPVRLLDQVAELVGAAKEISVLGPWCGGL